MISGFPNLIMKQVKVKVCLGHGGGDYHGIGNLI